MRISAQSDNASMFSGKKILFLGLQCAVLMMATFIVWILMADRRDTSRRTVYDIASDWGGQVHVEVPSIDGDDVVFVPEKTDVQVQVNSHTLHRNTYEAEVFDAHVEIQGQFLKSKLFTDKEALIEMPIYTNQVTNLAPLQIGGQTLKWEKSSKGLGVRVNFADMPEVIDFSTAYDVRGSDMLNVELIGEGSVVEISGEVSNPSFGGEGAPLPAERTIDGRRFSARWVAGVSDMSYFASMRCLVGVDRYQQVDRSLKYAFIIILLTYVSVLFSEVILRRNIPLLNYFLIGAALVVFYSLLLSFVEHLSFGASYLIASVMTIGLIAGYMWKNLASARGALVIAAILSAIYGCIFILLSMETYALLAGSLILFAVLAAMMYASLKFNNK